MIPNNSDDPMEKTIMFVILLLLVVGGLSILLVLRKRKSGRAERSSQKTSTQTTDSIKVGGDIPAFNVIALGGQETGKTVLLASMFHTLTTEINDGVFRLETSLDESVHLTDLFVKLRDPDAAWPPGTSTAETRSFAFTCVGSAGGDEFSVLKFNYLDYAGEFVGGGPASSAALEQRAGRQRELEQHIESAHALFGIIDGQRMVAYLQGDPKGAVYIETAIIPMIAVMRKAKCPIHFIVTKWDLLDGRMESSDLLNENDRLAVVRDALMAQPSIRNLVEGRRREKRVVRLIPVSAIGKHFATVDVEGHMIKRKDGRLRPFNVEIPLCAVLPDLFGQITEQLEETDVEKLLDDWRARAQLTSGEALSVVAKVLARPVGLVLRGAADIAIGRSAFSDSIADTFVNWVARPFDEKMNRVGTAVDEAKRELSELRLARNAVLREFNERMIALKRQLPASDLADWGMR